MTRKKPIERRPVELQSSALASDAIAGTGGENSSTPGLDMTRRRRAPSRFGLQAESRQDGRAPGAVPALSMIFSAGKKFCTIQWRPDVDLDRAVSLGCWFSVGPAMLAGERGQALAAR